MTSEEELQKQLDESAFAIDLFKDEDDRMKTKIAEQEKEIERLKGFVEDVARGQYGELKGDFIHRITKQAKELISPQSIKQT